MKLAGLTVRPVFEVPAGAPAEFRVLSAGVNRTEKGDFLFDDEAAQMCMGFWANKGVDLSFDYEHQALADPPVEAPAAGWWTPAVRNGELWATSIRWTDRARARLEAREYRYFSPAFQFDEASGRVTRLINVALTNNPAMDQIAPLVAATAKQQEPKMELEKLVAELKAQNATLTAELAALKAKLSMADEEKDGEEVCKAVGLKSGAGRTERLSAVRSLSAFHAEVRKLTGVENDAEALGRLSTWKSEAGDAAQLKAEKTEFEAAALKAELSSVLEAATKEGKVPPAEDHKLRVALVAGVMGMGGGVVTKNGIAWLRGAVGALPVLAAGGQGAPTPDAQLMTDLDRKLSSGFGHDPVAFAKFKADRVAQR